MPFSQGFPIDSESQTTPGPWKVLIADNEEEVHLVTRMVLEDFQFENREIELLSSYNEEETRDLVKANPDLALILLDVVMDTEHSGLDIVKYIRENQSNPFLRIILRTGQPGRAPESRVINDYDINDYKEKTELTSQKLRTATIGALRAYRDLRRIEKEQRRLDSGWRFLTHIINSLNSILIVVDEDSRITLWNTAAEDAVGISEKKARGKPLTEILPWANQWENEITGALKDGTPRALSRSPITQKGQTYMDVRFFPLKQEGTEGLVILLDDVTELHWKEEQLRRSQKLEAVGSLSSGLAHDINNILGGITGAISLIDFEKSSAPALHNSNYDPYLSTIRDSAERASSLVQRLLTLTRRTEVHSDPIDLNRVVHNVMKICESSFDKVIELRKIPAETPAVILGDYPQIEQVLLNLCINAAHAMTIMRPTGEVQGGILTVEVKPLEKDHPAGVGKAVFQDQGGWEVSVTDQGVGIPQNVQSKIFDPFYTTKKNASGTGLGLSMVHNIVQQYNGFIDLETAPGKGTTFRLLFPATGGGTPRTKSVNAPQIPRGTGTILLCDDEELMLRVGSKILEKCGYRVITASDGEKAVETYFEKSADVDLVILDMLMPKLSGVDVFRRMKDHNPGVKVVLSSGFREDDRVKTVMKEGARAFLEKPYTMNKLAETLSLVLKNEDSD